MFISEKHATFCKLSWSRECLIESRMIIELLILVNYICEFKQSIHKHLFHVSLSKWNIQANINYNDVDWNKDMFDQERAVRHCFSTCHRSRFKFIFERFKFRRKWVRYFKRCKAWLLRKKCFWFNINHCVCTQSNRIKNIPVFLYLGVDCVSNMKVSGHKPFCSIWSTSAYPIHLHKANSTEKQCCDSNCKGYLIVDPMNHKHKWPYQVLRGRQIHIILTHEDSGFTQRCLRTLHMQFD